MAQIYGALIAAIIIFIWVVNCQYQSYALSNLLSGFWEADSSFCEESGLDLFCIYLDEDYDSMGKRACYILASQDDAVILNEPTTATISLQWARLNNYSMSLHDPKYFTISFKEISDDGVDIFPKHQQMRFYPICNKIVLFYDDTITAVLYKNPINTELRSIIQEKK